jgi:hypothetical protein
MPNSTTHSFNMYYSIQIVNNNSKENVTFYINCSFILSQNMQFNFLPALLRPDENVVLDLYINVSKYCSTMPLFTEVVFWGFIYILSYIQY